MDMIVQRNDAERSKKKCVVYEPQRGNKERYLPAQNEMVQEDEQHSIQSFDYQRGDSEIGLTVAALTPEEKIREYRDEIGYAKCLSAGEALAARLHDRSHVEPRHDNLHKASNCRTEEKR